MDDKKARNLWTSSGRRRFGIMTKPTQNSLGAKSRSQKTSYGDEMSWRSPFSFVRYLVSKAPLPPWERGLGWGFKPTKNRSVASAVHQRFPCQNGFTAGEPK